MTPVFQTDFAYGTGNCLQAVIASLFDLSLEDVPHFIIQDDWKQCLMDFYKSKGYNYTGNSWASNNYLALKDREYHLINPNIHMDTSEMIFVGDYACATVLSPKYYKNKNLNRGNHAVIINRKCEVVHDPVPDYHGIEYPLTKILGSNGIIMIDQIL